MNKIIEGLNEAATSTKCQHKFKYVSSTISNGVIGRCIAKCKCRFTAWPGTIYYEEILAAKGREE